MTDTPILYPSVHATPSSYVVAGSQEIILKGVTASFDGSSAAGSYVPAFQVIDPGGNVIGTYTLNETLAAGASADVSWFPGIGNAAPSTSAGNYVTLFDQTLAAPAASFNFTSIPQTFASLEIIATLRSASANPEDAVDVTFNADTGLQYHWLDSQGNHGVSAPAMSLMAAVGGGANASHFAYNRLLVADYSHLTTDHGIFGSYFYISDETIVGTYHLVDAGGQRCKSPADKVTSLQIFIDNGSNFDIGSRVTIAGMN